MRRAASILLALSLLIACAPGDDGASRGGAAGGDPDGRRLARIRGAARGAQASQVELRPFVEGLTSPLGLVHAADGTRRLYAVEQTGRIKVIRRRRVAARPFLDISSRITSGGEQGLLGLAFHPRYERNRRFYVNYTDPNGDTVVAEFRRDPERSGLALAASERVLLRIDQPFANHNGGALAFGRDGYLYIATGDGGSAGDPQNNGQRLDTLLGKILRIDVNARPGGAPYGVPPDNPFVDRAGARGEIWAYGLRNPWRFSFDRNRIWIGDVGQNELEEVNRAAAGDAGLNYGWRIKEGDRCYPSDPCAPTLEELTDPIAVYSHDFGCSVTGGYVYRGSSHPELVGTYLFGDYCSGNIWGLDAAGPSPQEPRLLLESGRSISSFGVDRRGEIYVTDLTSGAILRVAA